ncbi:hypothetical protein VZ95_15885 [Elstera litoralis]|uniref:Uncharacterized protein n=1 Tax=Elstera litoralis TaxID=552518 RepID=A0A0F3IPR2_9PROT|nr:DUF1778 domain-containing protein [Elstera litoralis]KJV08730.1 hypothetical protein VZ95_15885 [Elstera litoralis]
MTTSKYLAELQRSDLARPTTVSLRLTPEVRGLVDAAATALGLTRQVYIVDSAHRRAVDVLLDQRVFNLGDSAAAVIHDALTGPLEPAPALVDLLRGSPMSQNR